MVVLAAAPLDQLFVHAGEENERDRQLLDDLGLSGVKHTSAVAECHKLNREPLPLNLVSLSFPLKAKYVCI